MERMNRIMLQNLLRLRKRSVVQSNPIASEDVAILTKGVPIGVFCYSAAADEQFLYIGPDFLNMLGYTAQEFQQQFDNRFSSMIFSADLDRVQEELDLIVQAEANAEQFYPCEYRVRAKDGSLRWLHEERCLRVNDHGRMVFDVAVMDITERHNRAESEEILLSCIRQLNSNANFEHVMHHVLASILRFYDGARAYVFEFDWVENTTTNTYEACAPDVVPEINNLQNVPIVAMDTWIRAFEHGENVFQIEDVSALADDPLRQMEYETLNNQNIKALIAVPIRYNGTLHGFLGVDDPARNQAQSAFLVNLTYFICNEMDKRHLNEELRKLSYSDYLTQFNNRNAYNAYLQAVAEDTLQNVGVLFADLNSLKYMNDTFGHEYGDRLLHHMSDILKRHFPPQQIYRVSGDEFVIICADCPESTFQFMVCRLLDDLAAQTEELASVGYVWEQEVTDLKKMIYQAEQLMYQNKQQYYAENPDRREKRSELTRMFLRTMQKDTFTFYLQPQIDSRTSALIGAEALARRITCNGEVVLPYDFIPILEREQLISKLDFHIMEQVCQQLHQWKQAGCAVIPISVNFSSITLLEQGFVDRFTAMCSRYGIGTNLLIIEITRAGNRLGREPLRQLIHSLHVYGIRVRVKNLTMENDFPAMMTMDGIDSVKLDISLIREMEKHYRTQVLVQTLIDLCHRMNQDCMASGVETQSQADLLRSMHCDSLQGFFFGQPVTAVEFEELYLKGSLVGEPSHAAEAVDQTMETDLLPTSLSAMDSVLFELLSRTTEQTYIYVANLQNDFSRWSPSAVQYFGLPSEYIKNTAKVWSSYIHPDDRHIFMDDIGQIMEGKSNRHSCEYRARNARGEYVWVKCSGVAVMQPDGSPGLFAGTMVNLKNVSKFDPVTGLLSPYEFQSQFEKMLDNDAAGILLLFGIDHFKRINDMYGYQLGDKILRYIAQQVQLIPGCIFFRMDGDKIACVVSDGTRQDVETVYGQVRHIMMTASIANETDVQLSASCGAVIYPQHGTQLEVLRANAEYALEQAKKTKRGSLAIYSEELHKKSVLSFQLQEILRKAITNRFEGFSLCYQPLIDAATGKVFGAEALLRFSTEALPLVSPAEFIPVLEETGEINEVGTWVLQTALCQAAKWRKIYPDFHISINASYIQMCRPDFREKVIRELSYNEFPPEALILELTESCKIIDPEHLKNDFDFFASHQINMALDDFGTGYASIAMLRQLTPTWIKIDHTFVASITENTMDQAIIEYILQLCKHAKIRVCIEGVETAEVLRIVCQYEPDLLQGYYFSRPLTAELFEQTYIVGQEQVEAKELGRK